MLATSHFVWNIDPTAFNLGTIPMPFPIAIWGIVLAIVFIFFGYAKITPEAPKHSKKTPEPDAWKVWALVIGSLIVGQIIFLVLPSPVFSQIGPIRPRWYGMMFAGAFVFGYFIMLKMFKYAGRTQEQLDVLLTYVLIATVIGARLGHVLFYEPGYYLSNPGQIIAIWNGGLASHGAAIGILLAMYLYAKRFADMSFLWIADRVVVAVASGGAFIRTGNFFNSEIVGKPSNLPWAIIFPRAHVANPGLSRHPSMLYEAILCIIVCVILWRVYKHYKTRPPEGAMFGTFLVLLFGGRFFLEFMKVHQADFVTGWAINMGQWLSIPLVLWGGWLLFKRVEWNEPKPASSTTT